MAETSLPDLSLIWSSAGDILQPSNSKIQSGWAAEIPPRQWFNWLDNRQDQSLVHIAQHGIAEWSTTLEYIAGKSYVQGSNGIIYKALTTNTNSDPTSNPSDWQVAFATASQAVQVATDVQARAQTDNTVFISPLQLANAFTGSNRSTSTNSIFQKLPGGVYIQGGVAPIGTGATQAFTVAFPTRCISLAFAPTATTTPFFTTFNNTGFTYTAPNTFRWIAIGD